MSQSDVKKNNELKWLSAFLKKYGKLPSDIQIIPGETPDFILCSNNKKIGVEITTLVKPDLKKEEMLRKKIIDRSRAMSAGKYVDNMHVQINFVETRINVGSKEIDGLAQLVIQLIDVLYEKGKVQEEKTYKSTGEYYESGIVSSITLSPNQKSSEWYSAEGFLVPHVDPDFLKQCILKKQSSIRKYKARCNENWLLIVSNLLDESSSHDFTSIKTNLKFETKFHHVFVYKAFGNRFIRLNLQYKK